MFLNERFFFNPPFFSSASIAWINDCSMLEHVVELQVELHDKLFLTKLDDLKPFLQCHRLSDRHPGQIAPLTDFGECCRERLYNHLNQLKCWFDLCPCWCLAVNAEGLLRMMGKTCSRKLELGDEARRVAMGLSEDGWTLKVILRPLHKYVIIFNQIILYYYHYSHHFLYIQATLTIINLSLRP